MANDTPTSSDTSDLKKPQNPLLNFRSYTTKHILVGFSNTVDATSTILVPDIGKIGEQITGNGCKKPAIVIVNEFSDDQHIIFAHHNEYDFNLNKDSSKSAMSGILTLTEKLGGNFLNFMRESVAKPLNLAQSHVIFAHRTFFIGKTFDGSSQVVATKPLYFHIYSISQSFGKTPSENFYSLMYLADYNTYAQLPQYNKLYQMTVTHKENNTTAGMQTVPYNPGYTKPPVGTGSSADCDNIPNIDCNLSTPVSAVSNSGIDVATAAAYNAGFRGSNLIQMVAIAGAESSWNTEAHNLDPAYIGYSKGYDWNGAFGLWQIRCCRNYSSFTGVDGMRDKDKCVDPDFCAKTAFVLSHNGQNLGGWAASKNAWCKYIPNAIAAVKSLCGQASTSGLNIQNVINSLANNNGLNLKLDLINNIANNSRQVNQLRQQRIVGTKTMTNLQDLMGGFESELKNQVTPKKSRVENFYSIVRPSYVKNLLPVKQDKDHGSLPLDYNIHLDNAYADYVLDNRNIPFEQPEQSQDQPGIKHFAVKPGKTIDGAIRNMFKLSSKVGDDSISSEGAKAMMTNLSTIKTCDDKYQIDIHIKQYTIPYNSMTSDSGPGESFVAPLAFHYNKNDKSRDIIKLSTSLFSDTALNVMEQNNNSQDNRSVLGGREQITYERNSSEDFFKTSYSGVRVMTDQRNYGLENPQAVAGYDAVNRINLIQNTELTMEIIGNPDFMSDLFRDPIKVSQEDPDSPVFYKFPEYYPMYAKVEIYLKPVNSTGLSVDQSIDPKFYYTGYYHIGHVTTTLHGGELKQILKLYRTDDTL